jgi:hypothetical protein
MSRRLRSVIPLIVILLLSLAVVFSTLPRRGFSQPPPGSCPGGYDIKTFTDPITINGATTWMCVDYTIDYATITQTGSLNITDSIIQTKTWLGFEVHGQLQIDSSTIFEQVAVYPESGIILNAKNSTIQILTIYSTYDVLNITAFDATAFQSPAGWNASTSWGILNRTIFLQSTTVNEVYLTVSGGSLHLDNAQFNTVRLGGGTADVQHLHVSSLEISGSANATIQDVTSPMPFLFPVISIDPSDGITVTNFNAALLAGSYNFTSEWGMDWPRVVIGSTTTHEVHVGLQTGVTGTFSASSDLSIFVNGGNAYVENGSTVNIHVGGPFGGTATVTDSHIISGGMSNGTLNIISSTADWLQLMGGNSTVTSSTVYTLELINDRDAGGSVIVRDFDQTHDAGNYVYDAWGFSRLHARTSASTVGAVVLSVYSGILHVTGSTVNQVAAYESGVADIANSTIVWATAGHGGGHVQLLNVTDTADDAVYGGVLDKSWYTFVNVYDASTGLPLDGVALNIADNLGNIQNANVDGSARLILQEYAKLSNATETWTVLYYPYTLTASKSGYNPTIAIIGSFSNPTINFYLTQQSTTTISSSTTTTVTTTGTNMTTTVTTGTNTTTTVTITTGTNTTATGGLSIAFGSAHVTVQQGGTAQFTVAVSSPQPVQVNLALSSVPSGWQYTFAPASGSANPQFTSTLTITTSASTAPRAYAVVVNATADNGESAVASVIVEVTSPPQTPSTGTTTQRCMIATAAYGGETSPDVLYMRYVRDGLIGSTATGRVLVNAFNTFYYSWSPAIAQAIADNEPLRDIFRVLLVPLLLIVHVTAWTFIALGTGDLASVAAFTVAAALSVLVYVMVPAFMVREVWRQNQRRRHGGASEQ